MSPEENKTAQTRQALSRRELLKILAAGSGAFATFAFLPGQWRKPQVGISRLPAHAMATMLTCVEVYSIKSISYLGDGMWSVVVNWSPSWPTKPQISVIMGGEVVTNPGLVFMEIAGPYYQVQITFEYPEGGDGFEAGVEGCFFPEVGEPCCLYETITGILPPD